jgi:hypothetical protein
MQKELDQMRETIAIMAHHDAITGTSKQHVASDYFNRIEAASISNINLYTNQVISMFDEY